MITRVIYQMNHNRLNKIRPVVEDLVNKFKTVYEPEKHVSIDEELLLWKGHLSFKQYAPNKRVRFGIKMFSLCEVDICGAALCIWGKTTIQQKMKSIKKEN